VLDPGFAQTEALSEDLEIGLGTIGGHREVKSDCLRLFIRAVAFCWPDSRLFDHTDGKGCLGPDEQFAMHYLYGMCPYFGR